METLYSLAGMFAGNKEPKNGCKLDNTYLDACPSTLQEPSEPFDLILKVLFLLFFSSFFYR